MRHSFLNIGLSATIVTVSMAAVTPVAAYTITVEPLPTLTFPEKPGPRVSSGRDCPARAAPCPAPRPRR